MKVDHDIYILFNQMVSRARKNCPVWIDWDLDGEFSACGGICLNFPTLSKTSKRHA